MPNLFCSSPFPPFYPIQSNLLVYRIFCCLIYIGASLHIFFIRMTTFFVAQIRVIFGTAHRRRKLLETQHFFASFQQKTYMHTECDSFLFARFISLPLSSLPFALSYFYLLKLNSFRCVVAQIHAHTSHAYDGPSTRLRNSS